MRYKDHSPTFWNLYFYRNITSQSLLSDKRFYEGRIAFLVAFWGVLKWDIRLKGIKKALHDWFIGIREL